MPIEYAFDDAPEEPILTFASCWREAVAVAEDEAQTDPLECAHVRTQHPKTKVCEAQCDPPDSHSPAPTVRGNIEVSRQLDAFLEQCTPLLEEQLHRNLGTRAFDGDEPVWEEQHDQVDCLHSLKHQGALAALSPEGCTAVAWNAPGTVVAAAYGALSRDDWPRCSSMLCTWSVFRRSLDPSKADAAIELPDCLTCLAFHPTDPALLAGGSYNGDVLLWRLGTPGDPLVGKSTLTNYTHHEPVQRLSWTRDPSLRGGQQGFVLASVCADGKMLLWSVDSALRMPVGGLLVSRPGGGPRSDASEGGGGRAEGGAALSFSSHDPTSFVMGLESGLLVKGSLLANEARTARSVLREVSEIPWSHQAAALLTRVPPSHYSRLKSKVEKEAVLARGKQVEPSHVYAAAPEPSVLFGSPVTVSYSPHSGPVYEARYSPFHRNAFLSASTDASLRLYNQLQQAPCLVTEPGTASIFSAAWSPSRPLVFAAAAADGNLHIYDLKRSKAKPEVTLKVTTDRSAVTCVAFNPRSPELLATADAQGFVKIWRLSTFLSEPAPRELEIFSRLVAPRGGDREGDSDEEQAG